MGRGPFPRRRMRIPWPRRPAFLEPAGHHGEESSPSPFHLHLQKDPQPPVVKSHLCGRRFSDRPEGGLPFTRGCFHWCSSIEGPIKKEDVPRGQEETARRVTPSPPLCLHLNRGHRSSRDLHPPFLHLLTHRASIYLPLLMCPRSPNGGMSCLPPQGI
jgi:hypothetical protein